MNSESRNIRDLCRGINYIKRGYQHRSNFVKDENGDLFANSNKILNRWKNYFSQLLNVHNNSLIRQTEMLTAYTVVPGPSHVGVAIAIANLKKFKSPGSDQIPAELIQAGGEALLPDECVALVRTDVLEERIASIIRVTRIGKLGTVLAVTSSQSTLITETVCSSEMLVLTHGITSKKTVFFIVTAVKPQILLSSTKLFIMCTVE
jgi:hypothetical protein